MTYMTLRRYSRNQRLTNTQWRIIREENMDGPLISLFYIYSLIFMHGLFNNNNMLFVIRQ